MPKKPNSLKTPLRKRKEIIQHLLEVTDQRSYDGTPYPFCFNVKVYSTDLSFENLLRIMRETESDPPYSHDPKWLAAVQEKYNEVEEHLFDWGLEDAQAYFVGHGRNEGPSDGACTLWDGRVCEGVEFSFQGYSSGWLSLDRFESYNFTSREYDIKDLLEEMPYNTLRKLYAFILQIKADTKYAKTEVEYQAMSNFFNNACSDIEKPE